MSSFGIYNFDKELSFDENLKLHQEKVVEVFNTIYKKSPETIDTMIKEYGVAYRITPEVIRYLLKKHDDNKLSKDYSDLWDKYRESDGKPDMDITLQLSDLEIQHHMKTPHHYEAWIFPLMSSNLVIEFACDYIANCKGNALDDLYNGKILEITNRPEEYYYVEKMFNAYYN